MATPFHVKNNKTWCPQCKFYICEEICRDILNNVWKFIQKLGHTVKQKKQSLEVDRYNNKLKILFEYDDNNYYDFITILLRFYYDFIGIIKQSNKKWWN